MEYLTGLSDPRRGQSLVAHVGHPGSNLSRCDPRYRHRTEPGKYPGSEQRLVTGAGFRLQSETAEPPGGPFGEVDLPRGRVDPRPPVGLTELAAEPTLSIHLAAVGLRVFHAVGSAVAGTPRLRTVGDLVHRTVHQKTHLSAVLPRC